MLTFWFQQFAPEHLVLDGRPRQRGAPFFLRQKNGGRKSPGGTLPTHILSDIGRSFRQKSAARVRGTTEVAGGSRNLKSVPSSEPPSKAEGESERRRNQGEIPKRGKPLLGRWWKGSFKRGNPSEGCPLLTSLFPHFLLAKKMGRLFDGAIRPIQGDQAQIAETIDKG